MNSLDRENARKVAKALRLLVPDDEQKGQQALSIIGKLSSVAWFLRILKFWVGSLELYATQVHSINKKNKASGELDTAPTPSSLEDILIESENVRVLPGWGMGDMFDVGLCAFPRQGPPIWPEWLDDGIEAYISISSGCCFFVQTNMLPILEAATDGRVSPRRLWQLVMTKRQSSLYEDPHILPGVDYGPVTRYMTQ